MYVTIIYEFYDENNDLFHAKKADVVYWDENNLNETIDWWRYKNNLIFKINSPKILKGKNPEPVDSLLYVEYHKHNCVYLYYQHKFENLKDGNRG